MGPSASGFRGATDPWRGWGAVGRHVPRRSIVGPLSGGRVPVGGQSGALARRHSGRSQRGPAAALTATLAAMMPVLLRIPGVVNISGKMSQWLEVCLTLCPGLWHLNAKMGNAKEEGHGSKRGNPSKTRRIIPLSSALHVLASPFHIQKISMAGNGSHSRGSLLNGPETYLRTTALIIAPCKTHLAAPRVE